MRGLSFPKSKFKRISGLLDMMREMAVSYNIDPSHAEKLAAGMKVTLTESEIKKLTDAASATGIRQQGIWEPQ